MREILFRGKRVDNDEWVEGNLFVSDTDGRTHILVGTRRFTIEWEVDPYTVGQYTGLKDKNGKRIFDGDIVRFAERRLGGEDASVVEQVTFDEGGFCTHRYFLNNWLRNGLCGNTKLEGIEVIGNIHDNPELLEADNE